MRNTWLRSGIFSEKAGGILAFGVCKRPASDAAAPEIGRVGRAYSIRFITDSALLHDPGFVLKRCVRRNVPSLLAGEGQHVG
jgi:hypothetical protein